MKFLYADTQDYIDPDYDFIQDSSKPDRRPYWDDHYAHQMIQPAPYDGLLLSMSAIRHAKGVAASKVRYSTSAQQRLLREGVRRFVRMEDECFRDAMLMGDCGAFAYVDQPQPAYTPQEVFEFYAQAGFTHGCSPDHIIFEYDSNNPSRDSQSAEVCYRYDITLSNAHDFLQLTRQAGDPFEPLGAVQGWSPRSMAEAAATLEGMGYRYLAIGGLVPLKVEQIHEVLREIRAAIRPETHIHLLGFAKAESIHEFLDYQITSFDSTSPLIRAFKDAKANYYMPAHDTGLAYYTAIRIPQAIENPKLLQGIKKGVLSAERLMQLEKHALAQLRAYDQHQVDVTTAQQAVMDYLATGLLGGKDEADQAKKIQKALSLIEPTLRAKPWQHCPCPICRAAGVEVIIFRGANRNKRRGFHNLWVYYTHLQRILGTATP